MSKLAEIKKRSQESFTKLQQEVENSKKSYTDSRFWAPTRGKDGNGSAVIRFLPPAEGEDLAFVKYYDYFNQGPKGYYIEKCRSTLGLPDPMYKYVGTLWDVDKDQAGKLNRKTNFVANILVVKDPANTENEGKVFLYRYGTKIAAKLEKIMQKDEALGVDPVNYYDWEKGRNFKLDVKTVHKYPNYDDSFFLEPSAIPDDKIEDIYGKLYKLAEFTDPSLFKSYEVLKKQRNKALGLTFDEGEDDHIDENTPRVSLTESKTQSSEPVRDTKIEEKVEEEMKKIVESSEKKTDNSEEFDVDALIAAIK